MSQISYYVNELDLLNINGQKRVIPPIVSKYNDKINIDGNEYVNFASNDYLGLSTKEELRNEFIASNDDYFSSASARLLTGSLPIYNKLEHFLSGLFNKEKALIFNTGYQCNLGVISSLIKRGDVVFSDKLNHASIIDGMRLSEGEFYRFKHLDYNNLEQLLKKYRNQYKKALIVSESIFSMDGDLADINRLIELKNKYDCMLMIDEAHAFCCYGTSFSGAFGGNDIDIVTATFGKALGSFGAFCTASEDIIDYLINTSRSFIFSTSLPPINIAWTYWLLAEKRDYILSRQKKLFELVKNAHDYLNLRNIETPSCSQIIPIVIGNNAKTIDVSEQLKTKGYYIPAIRPPTVPEGTSRLRISLTSDIELSDFKNVIDILK